MLRTSLGILIMLLGFGLIAGAALFWIDASLAAQQATIPHYLRLGQESLPTIGLLPGEEIALAAPETPLASTDPTLLPTPKALASDDEGGTALSASDLPLQEDRPASPTPTTVDLSASVSETLVSTVSVSETPAPTATPEPPPYSEVSAPSQVAPESTSPTPTLPSVAYLQDPPPAVYEAEIISTPTPLPSASAGNETAPTVESAPDMSQRASYAPSQAVVRLVIPRLKVKRAVVDIGLKGGREWDTDSLFATNNRPDLVGHLQGSALPGESSNIVLVGHNYDYNAAGVFVNLHKLKPGDLVKVITEDGVEHTYEVAKVKTVPYSGNNSGLDRHLRFMGPTPEETLTLLTCGGANIGFFNKRVYVVAYPLD